MVSREAKLGPGLFCCFGNETANCWEANRKAAIVRFNVRANGRLQWQHWQVAPGIGNVADVVSDCRVCKISLGRILVVSAPTQTHVNYYTLP